MRRPDAAALLVYLAVKRARKGLTPETADELADVAARAGDAGRDALRAFAGDDTADKVCDALARGHLPTLERALQDIAAAVDVQLRRPSAVAARAFHETRRTIRRIARPTGFAVCLAGPDGVGKSTLTQALLALGGGPFHTRIRLGQRRGFFRKPGELLRRPQADANRPHHRRPSNLAGSTARLVYMWLDALVGWLPKIGLARRRTTLVVLERPFVDFAIDPKRYRLSTPPALARALARAAAAPRSGARPDRARTRGARAQARAAAAGARAAARGVAHRGSAQRLSGARRLRRAGGDVRGRARPRRRDARPPPRRPRSRTRGATAARLAVAGGHAPSRDATARRDALRDPGGLRPAARGPLPPRPAARRARRLGRRDGPPARPRPHDPDRPGDRRGTRDRGCTRTSACHALRGRGAQRPSRRTRAPRRPRRPQARRLREGGGERRVEARAGARRARAARRRAAGELHGAAPARRADLGGLRAPAARASDLARPRQPAARAERALGAHRARVAGGPPRPRRRGRGARRLHRLEHRCRRSRPARGRRLGARRCGAPARGSLPVAAPAARAVRRGNPRRARARRARAGPPGARARGTARHRRSRSRPARCCAPHGAPAPSTAPSRSTSPS